MIIDFVTWNVSPEIFSIGSLHIRWYGLLFASAFVAGYLIFTHMFKKEGVPMELLDKLTLYMVLGTIIGARLGHCFFYEPEYYLRNPIEILKTWHGGLASHGAAIGILLALYLFCRKSKKSYFWILDRIVIVVALAGLFIRTGNLMNSEIYGVQTNLPWGFVFVRAGEVLPKHPTQLYEGLSYFFIFGLLYYLYEKKISKLKGGTLFSLFLILVFVARFLIEFVKEDQESFESTMSLNMGQLLSIPFVLAGVLILVWLYVIKKDKGPSHENNLPKK
ncbi:MAG: prolipoprotein diacylglyceryl transferase [Bacteroidota bacterium]|nr:prolipoprotein diacylglyceryl transferase [Bacteroidota bacterium]MDP4226517.1 prolipoprotein diacylglyceryl transferase [Bacteroidota bacterium]MDP4274443.1 prolipoprotein diacylglyceryl transferase [Bacteroidota bacterium]